MGEEEKKTYHCWIDGTAIFCCEVEKHADGWWQIAGTEQLLCRYPTEEKTKRIFKIFKKQIGDYYHLKN